MKAYVLNGINELIKTEVEKPVIGADDVLVKVMAAGICGSDIPRIFKTGAHVHPLIPGHEFSGKVVECGDNAREWADANVGIFPLIPCMKCDCCKNKQYQMCKNYSYLGSRCDGGFAEYVKVPAWNLIKLPDNLSFEEAAMLEPLSVSAHAVRKAVKGVNKEAFVCVWGLGTIGLMCVSILKAMGYNNTIAVAKKKRQIELANKCGVPAEFCVDINSGDPFDVINKLTYGNGVDVSFECVGRPESAEACVKISAPGAKVMFVGNPASDMNFSKDVYWNILRHELTIYGTWNSSFTHEDDDDWHFVTDLLNEGKIDK
ncbi:MAG: galactitol-1-phosphate 5-dehydrogenase, partial [Lachnospiraceae bacterium]|nr:galactitol-1-phosphate 5-dehydrogenase [Lachnospiraceae bacterium]